MFKQIKKYICHHKVFLLFLSFFCLFFYTLCFPEIIDRILAVVNDEVITLTDVKICETFGLYENEHAKNGDNLHLQILEQLIDQKLVIQLNREDISVEKERIDSGLEKIISEIGKEDAEKKLLQFGMVWDDLRKFFYDNILYQEILLRKFGHVVNLNLKEIEAYYEQKYIPAQKEKGIEPKSIMEVLDEIEPAMKKEKMKSIVAEWIKNLKKRADIQILWKKDK